MSRDLQLMLKVLWVCLIMYPSVDFVFAEPTPAYEIVNEYFVEARGRGDRRPDGQLVLDQLRSENEKGPLANPKVVSLLNTLVAVVQAANSNVDIRVRCSNASFESIDLALSEIQENMLNNGEARLLDRMIYRFIVRRALSCQVYFPEMYEQSKIFITPVISGKVRFLLDRVIKRRLPGIELDPRRLERKDELLGIATQALYTTFVLGTETVGGPVDAELVYTAFGEMALNLLNERDKLDGQGRLKPSAVEEYYEKHLLEPCDEFSKRLGVYVFNQARSDALFLPIALGQNVKKNYEFYLAWAHQRLCHSLTELPEAFSSDLIHRYVWPSWFLDPNRASTSARP